MKKTRMVGFLVLVVMLILGITGNVTAAVGDSTLLVWLEVESVEELTVRYVPHFPEAPGLLGEIISGDGEHCLIDGMEGGGEYFCDFTYKEPGCKMAAFNIKDFDEKLVYLGIAPETPVGVEECVSEDPWGMFWLSEKHFTSYDAIIDYTWREGSVKLSWSEGSDPFTRDTVGGRESVQHEFPEVPATYRVGLFVDDIEQHHMCVSVTETTATEVDCVLPPQKLFSFFLPYVVKEKAEEELPPPLMCEGFPIQNPGFEQDCGWTLAGSQYTQMRVYEGEWAMLSGLVTGEQKAIFHEVSQEFVVPNNGFPAFLIYITTERMMPDFSLSSFSIEIWPESQLFSATNTPDVDTGYCYLMADEYSRVLNRFLWLEITEDLAWTEVSVDLTPYKGQRVGLVCGVYNDGLDWVSSMFIDQIQVVAN